VSANELASTISISANSNEQNFEIIVLNTGIIKFPNSEGIGLKSLRSKLRDVYAENYSFQIYQENDNVIAKIKIVNDEN